MYGQDLDTAAPFPDHYCETLAPNEVTSARWKCIVHLYIRSMVLIYKSISYKFVGKEHGLGSNDYFVKVRGPLSLWLQ